MPSEQLGGDAERFWAPFVLVSPETTHANQATIVAQTALPDELVGQWNGGPDLGEFWLTLTSDGRYELSNAKYGFSDSGVVALRPSSVTFTSEVTGKAQTRQWAFQTTPDVYGYTFSILWLDGYSYVKMNACLGRLR